MRASMTESEIEFIKTAAHYLERPSLIVRITDIIGKPIEKGLDLLPEGTKKRITEVAQKALEKALHLSIATIASGNQGSFENGRFTSYWTDWKHTALTMATGAAGGFFGLPVLGLELPVTTGIMLRSIASIADDYGHDLASIKIRLECLAVFALGSPSKQDDDMESAYFTARIGMSKLIEEAADWLAQKTAHELAHAITQKTTPILLQLINRVASRFEVVVTEKAIAEALPIIGTLSGAAINAAFSDHFNSVARHHFGILALESKYGEKAVRDIYRR